MVGLTVCKKFGAERKFCFANCGFSVIFVIHSRREKSATTGASGMRTVNLLSDSATCTGYLIT